MCTPPTAQPNIKLEFYFLGRSIGVFSFGGSFDGSRGCWPNRAFFPGLELTHCYHGYSHSPPRTRLFLTPSRNKALYWRQYEATLQQWTHPSFSWGLLAGQLFWAHWFLLSSKLKSIALFTSASTFWLETGELAACVTVNLGWLLRTVGHWLVCRSAGDFELSF